MLRTSVVAVGAACLIGLATGNASAQQGGGMCQGGGGGGAAGGGTGTTGSSSFSGGGNFRASGGVGSTMTAYSTPLGAVQAMTQAHNAQFRQAQLNALAANAQIRAETQQMWETARQRKQMAAAARERKLAANNSK